MASTSKPGDALFIPAVWWQATCDKSFDPVPSATVDPNLFAEAPATVDQIYRPGAAASSSYLDLSGEWRVNDILKLNLLVGSRARRAGRDPARPRRRSQLPEVRCMRC